MKKINIVIIISMFLATTINLRSSEVLFLQGKQFYDKKKFDQAKFKFEQDLVFNPKSEKSYLYIAKIYSQSEKIDLAETNLKSVLLLNPKNEDAIIELTKIKIKKSNFNETNILINKLEKVCKKMCEEIKSLKSMLHDAQNK